MKFFRKVRQDMIDTGSLRRYFAYAVGEILLVMIGILLALQVNNWNERRKEKLVELEFLKGLEGEMRANRDQMINAIEAHKKNIAAGHTIIQLFDQDISKIKESVLDSLFAGLTATFTYNPRIGKLNSIILSGKLDHIRNQKLKSYLTTFHDEAIDASEMYSKFLELKEARFDPLIDKLISRKNKYRLWFKDDLNTSSSFASNYESVFNSFEIENIANNMWVYMKFGLQEEEQHLASINEILNLISEGLEDESVKE